MLVNHGREPNPRRVGSEILLAWLLWLGIDFLAHGGIFASLYEGESTFLLAEEELFARIPLGYAAFFIYCAMTAWVVRKLQITQPNKGALAGLAVGAVVTAAGNMALLSISSIGIGLLAAWTATQVVEFAAAGGVLVWMGGRATLGRPFALILGATVLLLVVGVIVQNL